jgi:DNA-directed RNA polymerase specialized sigma24 family protein
LIDQTQPKLLSDVDLFVALCNEPSDDECYSEFVRRFLPNVMDECKRKCQVKKLDPHVGQEIAHKTLENARRSGTFEERKDAKDPRKTILVYLFQIATNLFNDHYRRKQRELQLQTLHRRTYFRDLIETDQYENDPEKLQKITDHAAYIFNQLNKKEKAVVLKDIEYKKHYRYLPDEVTGELAEELGVQKATIRKIRERASEKIKKAINEINQL